MTHELSIASRFWERVQKSDGCWEWTGGKDRPGGYGQLHVGTGNVKAHRAAWLFQRGPIPPGMHVLHRCDNPGCVRIDHLFLGTHQDNMADRLEKRRKGLRGPPPKPTPEQVEALCQLRADGARVSDLAREFGISQPLVSRITKRHRVGLSGT